MSDEKGKLTSARLRILNFLGDYRDLLIVIEILVILFGYIAYKFYQQGWSSIMTLSVLLILGWIRIIWLLWQR